MFTRLIKFSPVKLPNLFRLAKYWARTENLSEWNVLFYECIVEIEILWWIFYFHLQMHHTMDGLEMLDPASSMTTLTPMSETPSITSPHHQLHGSYHGMNHMMSHHHGGPLGGHTPGMNHYGNSFFCT